MVRFIKHKVFRALFVFLIAGPLAAFSEVNAQAGYLDPSFGNGGKVISQVYGGFYDLAIRPDGKIVAVGGDRIVRYNADGSLDSSFGTGGIVVIPAGVFETVYLNSVAIQPDGKIVIAVEVDSVVDPYSTFLIRLEGNGTSDATFNVGNTINGGGDAVAIQADGKIVSCGWDIFSWVARYHPNGESDTSFNSTGGVGTPDSSAFSVAVQADGKILVAGSSGSGYPGQFIIFRFNTDGSRDTSFGINGTVAPTFASHPGDSYARKLAIQADGKIVAAGVAAGVQLMVRYDPNGSLDTAFGNNGVVFEPYSDTYVFSGDVEIQPDGKIVTVGSFGDDFSVARYTPSGSIDTTLGGGDGLVTVDFNVSDDVAHGMTLDAQGRAVVVGKSSGASAIARVLLAVPNVMISGRILTPTGLGLRNSVVTLTDSTGNKRTVLTSTLGYYSFENIPAGETVTISAVSRRYRFQPVTRSASESLTNVDMVGIE